MAEVRFTSYVLLLAVITLFIIGRTGFDPFSFSVEYPLSLGAFIAMVVLYVYTLNSIKNAGEEELSAARITEPLSGLYNSTHFFSCMEGEIDRSVRNNYTFSLIYMDIDYFQRYNQDQGLKEGDKVITRLGELMTGVTRKYDLGFRFGNDEFAMVLPETDKIKSRIIAERIRNSFQLAYDGKLSLSIGISEWEKGDDVDRMLRKAETAMNEARRGGGNKIRAHIDRGPL